MADRFEYLKLLLGVKEKLLNSEAIRYRFADRISIIDSENDPWPEGKTLVTPFVGIMDDAGRLDLTGSGQQEEKLAIRFFVFSNQYPKGGGEQRVLNIVELWQVVVNETIVSVDRNDFSETSYKDATPIDEVYMISYTGTQRLSSPAHPNLLRKGFTAIYERVNEVDIV